MDIIIVSSDGAFRDLGHGGDASRPYRFHQVDSVNACIRLLSERTCALLVYDLYRHHGSDGRFLRWFRQTHPSAEVIVLSESDCELEMEETFRLGATAFLVKPVSTENLLATLQHILTERRAAV